MNSSVWLEPELRWPPRSEDMVELMQAKDLRFGTEFTRYGPALLSSRTEPFDDGSTRFYRTFRFEVPVWLCDLLVELAADGLQESQLDSVARCCIALLLGPQAKNFGGYEQRAANGRPLRVVVERGPYAIGSVAVGDYARISKIEAARLLVDWPSEDYEEPTGIPASIEALIRNELSGIVAESVVVYHLPDLGDVARNPWAEHSAYLELIAFVPKRTEIAVIVSGD
jgi:hypothetical protein